MADTTTHNGRIETSRQTRPPVRAPRGSTKHGQYQALFSRLQTFGFSPNGTKKKVGVISAGRGEGVTTIAWNLAVHAAAVHGLNVLLVDANQVNPCIHRLFQLQQSPGLAELIHGAAVETDCIRDMSLRPWGSWPVPIRQAFRPNRSFFGFLNPKGQETEAPRLSIIPAGTQLPGPRSSRHFDEAGVLDRASAAFDLVVVDLPAVNSTASCGCSLSELDGVIHVLEAERTSDIAVQKSILQIREQRTEILGVVFNKCRSHLPKWIDSRLGD